MYKDFIENTWMALRSGVWFGLESSMDENPYVHDGRRSRCPFFPLPQKTRLKNNKKCYSHWSWLARHQEVVTFFSSVGAPVCDTEVGCSPESAPETDTGYLISSCQGRRFRNRPACSQIAGWQCWGFRTHSGHSLRVSRLSLATGTRTVGQDFYSRQKQNQNKTATINFVFVFLFFFANILILVFFFLSYFES